MSLDKYIRSRISSNRHRRENPSGTLGMEIGRQYVLPAEYLFANSLVFASQNFISPTSLRRAITLHGREKNPSSRIMYGVQVGQSSHLIIGDGHHRICEDLCNGISPELTFDGWIPDLRLDELAEVYDCYASDLTIETDIVRSRILQKAGYLGVQALVPFSDFYDHYCCMRSTL